MIQFLLTISLVMHLLTFLWIVTLLQKVNNQQGRSINEDQLKREIEDLLVAYTTEMKEENEKLLAQLKTEQQSTNSIYSNQEKATELIKAEPLSLENKQQDIRANPVTRKQNNHVEKKSYEEYSPPVVEGMENASHYEQSNTAKVLLLAKQGLSTNEIAKKLNLGKGEVELMIKFYR